MITAFVKTLYGLGQAWPTEEDAYRQLQTELEQHGLGTTVYHRLKQSGRIMETPFAFREKLRRHYEACFVQNLLIKNETEKLLRYFDGLGIAVMPLKGTVLAERYYGHFAARGTSDIDLLVRPEQMDEAIRAVQQCGYNRPEESSPVHYHTEWCKDAPGLPEPVTVELHWSFVQQGVADMDVDVLWQEAGPMGEYRHVRMMGPEATFYTLCLHGASHQMESGKYVLDLLHMLCEHGDDIRLDRVLDQARRDRTLNRVKASLAVVYRLFPELERQLPAPVPLPLRGWPGFAGTGSRLAQIGYALRMLDSRRHQAVHVMRLLFPSRRLAAYSAGDDGEAATAATYFRLYRQRLRKMFGG